MIIWLMFWFTAGFLTILWKKRRERKDYEDLVVRSLKGQYLAAALSDPAKMSAYVNLLSVMSREQAQEIIINKWKTENHVL